MPGSCNACNKEFQDEAEQKLHYKSEWHRYNLKRKVSLSSTPFLLHLSFGNIAYDLKNVCWFCFFFGLLVALLITLYCQEIVIISYVLVYPFSSMLI